MDRVNARIHALNRRGRRLFESIGFYKTGEEGYRRDLWYQEKNHADTKSDG